MIRRVPIQDVTDGQAFALEGEVNDLLPKDNRIYVDENGRTYDPRDNVALSTLPERGVLALPPTTWW